MERAEWAVKQASLILKNQLDVGEMKQSNMLKQLDDEEDKKGLRGALEKGVIPQCFVLQDSSSANKTVGKLRFQLFLSLIYQTD